MKKTVKRILCGALAMAMCSSLAIESVFRWKDDGVTSAGASSGAAFKEVTGQFDTSALRESYFNDNVLKSEEVAPTYETRTVIVSLSGKNIVERAGDTSVPEYATTWSGEMAKNSIDKEQNAFLQALSKKGISYKLKHSYSSVLNGVAIEINTKHVSEIEEMKGVDSVVISQSYAVPETVDTANSNVKSAGGVVTNQTSVYPTGIYKPAEGIAETYGEGMVIAVLDTGLDYTHEAFQGFESSDVVPAWSRETVTDKLETNAKDLAAISRSGALDVSQVYMNEKVPYAYDYADDDPDVYPSFSNHGTHVAGIIGGYNKSGYTDKDGNPIKDEFKGVVPDAQLVICKVFTDDLDDPDLGGAVTEDIVAALNDCVYLGVDVINMSLGSSCGFTSTNDKDEEGELLNWVYNMVGEAGISLICAASNDYSAGYGGVYGTNLASNPDSGTVGSPSTFAAALSVASINGQKASYLVANGDNEDIKSFVFFEEARDINSNPFDFVDQMLKINPEGEFEYVVIPGVGSAADYTTAVRRLLKDANGNSTGRIALVKRGDTTFQEKVEVAKLMGAAGIIIYNNVAGVIRMNLGEVVEPIPAVSISMNAGAAMVNGAKEDGADDRLGKFTVDEKNAAGPFMSEFSSWGPTHDLKLKPEITAHGGEITSAVPGGYGEQSGTSMATPNMAGFMAIVRSYIKKDLGITDPVEVNRLAMQLTMSTAGTVYDQEGLPYSPRKQGAGVAKLENIVGETGTKAYLWTDNAANDYRPKLELGDDDAREEKDVFEMTFKVSNFGNQTLTFVPDYEFMTETLSRDKLTVSEQAYLLNASTSQWFVNNEEIGLKDTISVEKGETKEIKVILTLGQDDIDYIETSFENGMYVEGFLKLKSTTAGQCNLTLPFLGFYGDWEKAPMLDYSAYEVAENHQDASILEEDKIKASVWETQPFNMYYNNKYILPMGGYLYLLPDDAEPMYVDEEHNSVSRYNDYYGEGEASNYMTSTGLKAVYAGLLRNARLVKYNLYNEATGELIYSNKINRVAKAYSGGGSGVPANVELEFTPEEMGFVANGRYKMTFEFFQNMPEEGETAREEDTFEFSFTVDYDAPVMQDARIRYYNYEVDKKPKQRIYLDIDVYDNHYAQTIMLCYPKEDAEGDIVLQLATEYPTPIRNAVKNGVTTVSIEITDIYEKYGNQLYLQIDDYALNSCMYQVDLNKANAGVLPEGNEFSLAEGEETLSLNIYETHKVSLLFSDSYAGKGDLSNFEWSSANPRIAAVKNGEIVGMSKGRTRITVTNRKGATKFIDVTVSDQAGATLPKIPAISFEAIKTHSGSLQRPDDEATYGTIEVSAGANIQMSLKKEPWYHPADLVNGSKDLRVVWTSDNTAVATVDENGVVTTYKKGLAVIKASIEELDGAGKWAPTLYSATTKMYVQDEFTVSNYTLTDYNGPGGTVVIPSDLNVMYIGSEAFKDNNNIEKIVISSSVIDIQERAFLNCTALKEVSFAEDADVAMIYENAFDGCINLEKIDFSNVKVVTVAADCFRGCQKLKTVVEMTKIGTMHHRAFAGTALEEADIRNLHMSGDSVFADCKKLTTVKTDKFTAIGSNMFNGCTALEEKITISTPKIGNGAFSGCVNLKGVEFVSPKTGAVEFDIGARAFEGCGKNAESFTVSFGNETIRSIGARAFAGSKLTELGAINGLQILGENAFANTQVQTITLGDGLDVSQIRLTGIPFSGLTVQVAENSQDYAEENGVIYNGDKTKILFVNASVTGEWVVPAGVTAIGDYAFAGSLVSKVTLSNEVASIGVGAFKNAKLTAIDFAGAPIKVISESAFEGSSLTGVVLPDTVETICAYAFANSALTNSAGAPLQISGSKLTKIESYAFEGCKALTEITLGNTITNMGDCVFQDCIALTTVNMPSVTSLGVYTFSGASKLNKVTFGKEATTTGKYTFAFTPIETVVFGENVTTIDEGVFARCSNLKQITLPNKVTRIEAAAFAQCTALTTVEGIEKVQFFGEKSFWLASALEVSELTAAKEIREWAFSMLGYSNPIERAFTIPVAEEIASYAFSYSGITNLVLPKTLKVLGEGAFGKSVNLATVTVEAGNEYFFTEDNVLYRHTDKSAAECELIFYPAARVQSGKAGERTYVIKDGASRIAAYAFYGVNKGNVDSVVLPYSINAIGDSAFFESGITEYTFESINAPTLETVYREDVRAELAGNGGQMLAYKGYYYTNFETYYYYFTAQGGQKSALVMNYPRNGVGYDNPIYKTYFGTRTASETDLIEDATRDCIELIENMPAASEVATWVSWSVTDAEKKAYVENFANTLKTARVYYNNAIVDETQGSFISETIVEKLIAVEKEFRAVKKHFNIPFVIVRLEIAEDSTHKTEYLAGEKFDMTGLSLTIVYDDYSTEKADSSKIVLKDTGALITADSYVRILYEGRQVLAPITVTKAEKPQPPDSSDNSTSVEDSVTSDTSVGETQESGCKSSITSDYSMLAVAVLLAVMGGASILQRKRQKVRQNNNDIQVDLFEDNSFKGGSRRK